MPDPGPTAAAPAKESIKETLISILIAFVLAFVFRGFVIEAFVIPTGSMAPTLMGAHMRFTSPQSGYSWPVGPWQTQPGDPASAKPVQQNITVHDPMSGETLARTDVPIRGGDRILVEKFLYGISEPKRFDVVVFKCPYDPEVNFIKRLLGGGRGADGMGEEVAIVDGDVFTRSHPGGRMTTPTDETWSQPGWTIARKPASAQNAVWQAVFDSSFAPLTPVKDGRAWFQTPWSGQGAGWTVEGREYRYAGSTPTELLWDNDKRAISDEYAYDELPGSNRPGQWYPVSDVRLRTGVRPEADGLSVGMLLEARGHTFRARVGPDGVTLAMRPGAATDTGGAWTPLAPAGKSPSKPFAGFPKGKVTDVEFWHCDQALAVFINGACIARAEYAWTPDERILNATGSTIKDWIALSSAPGENVFARKVRYREARVRWEFSGGGALTLFRTALDRDLFYRPVEKPSGGPGLATHPRSTAVLGPNEFFCCGDNSPGSSDSRMWDTVDPWVAKEFWSDRGEEARPGIVPRDLMMGRAFFVYFPAPHGDALLPIPDFGRMRQIR